MTINIGGLFTLYRYTPGRRAWMLAQIRDAAERAGLGTIVARAAALVPNEKQLAADLQAWTVARAGIEAVQTSQALLAVDQERDGLLGDFLTALQAQARLSGRKSGQAAARLVTRLFPEGSRKIITLPYPDETMAIDALVDLAEDALADDIRDAAAGDWVADLKDANGRFAATYKNLSQKRSIDWSDLRASDAAAQERFLVLICHVVDVTFGTPAFRDVLDAVAVQQDSLKALYQGRRTIGDVDPTTGAPLPEPVATAPAGPTPTA